MPCGYSGATRRAGSPRRSPRSARRSRSSPRPGAGSSRGLAGLAAAGRGPPRDAATAEESRATRRPSPSRGSTSASTAPPRPPTRWPPASTSRSSTSRASSARTSSPSTARKLERGRGARPRRDHDPHPDGLRLSAAGALPQELRRRHGPAGRGRPGHGRAPRHLRARLHGQVLRGPRLSGPRQLLAELQRPGDALRGGAAQGLGGAQLLLQHRLRRDQRLHRRRAVVAPRRLRAAAGRRRPALRLLGVPRRHRPRQRLGDHRRPRPRLPAREPVFAGDRPPRYPGG